MRTFVTNRNAAVDRAQASADRADHLVAALDNRDVIGMAKGVLMHAEGIGPEEAFEVLVRASQHQNRKLHPVAEEIVSRYSDPGP